MSKYGDAIVKKIYARVLSGEPLSSEGLASFAKNVSDDIKSRFEEERGEFRIRPSSLGKPNRRLWYEKNMPDKKEPFTAPNLIKFMYGALIEHLVVLLMREAGIAVEDEQKRVTLTSHNGIEIEGAIDHKVDGRVNDVKSCSSYAFDKFKRNEVHKDDAFGYYQQIAAYTQAEGAEPGGWIAVDKVLGNITFADALPIYMPDRRSRIDEVARVVDLPAAPERCFPDEPFQKSGNMKLGTSCSYCPFKIECWKQSNHGHGLRIFAYANKPVFLTRVVAEPKVEEITNSWSNE